MQEDRSGIAMRVSWAGVAANLILSAFKLLAGLIARSGAMVSDAVHSASDVFSTLIVMVGVKAAARNSDEEHPYGHERMECVAALVLAVVLLITGLVIGWQGVKKIGAAHAGELAAPGVLALAAAAVSILVKEIMFRVTRKYARKIDSGALMADAWHHRSDALSSVGALIGIAGARLGLPLLDPLASVVICVFIVRAAVGIFRDAIDKMVDRSAGEETEQALRECALNHPEVRAVDRLTTREFGSRVYVEMEIALDGELPLTVAHAAAERVHDDIESSFPRVKHVMIHVNPCAAEKE